MTGLLDGLRQDGIERGARNTVVLATFSGITNLADGVTKVVLPLMATTFTDSPLQVAGVGMTLTLPWLVAALHIGVVIDRTDRRRALVVANAMRIGVLAALLVATYVGVVGLPLLYLVGTVLGVAEVVALTAAAAIVPQAVPGRGRDRANAWLTGTETVCNEFAGPFIGGLLVAAGTLFALGATTAAFVVSLAVPVLLRGRFRPHPDRDGSAAALPSRSEIVQGFAFLWRHPLLRTMALILTALCLSWGAWLAIMPLYATRLSHAGPFEYGLIMSSLGLGGVAGAVLTGPLNRRLGRRTVMLADLVGTFAMVGVPVVATAPVAVAAAAFLGGLGGTLWSVNSRTLNQGLVPEELMGRFHAAWRLLSWGALPIGAGLVGLLAEYVGMRVAFVPFALLTLVMVVPFLRHITPAAIAAAERAHALDEGQRT